jgi:ADP-heptose:LPS heptosyltransferase
MLEHIFFPFQIIKKDSSIVIYGAGKVGGRILKFIKNTEFCKVICFLDKNYEKKMNFPHKVLAPQEITNISGYSHILISVISQEFANEAKETLISLGVPKEKIILYRGYIRRLWLPEPEYLTDNNNQPLKIAFILYGGLGDALIGCLLIQEIRKLVPEALIDLYLVQKGILPKMPFIDNVYFLNCYTGENYYDVVFNVMRFTYFEKINLEKIKIHSQKLYEFCIDSIKICEKIVDYTNNDRCYSEYCLLLGKNRLEQSNPHNILTFDRHTPLNLEFDESGLKKMQELNLEKEKYIVIHNSINKILESSGKCWSAENFDALICLIKNDCPDLTIICTGTSYDFGKIKNADVDLIGKTNINELCALLKHSVLTIGVEGGIIHLNHFLGGKSVCLFGPTSIEVFGYEENINIRSDEPKKCINGCEHITAGWSNEGCLLGEKSLCMLALKPKMVYEKISLYLEKLFFGKKEKTYG